jgi:23S rRNA (cytidine2498-2'-O)-methyltransferase
MWIIFPGDPSDPIRSGMKLESLEGRLYQPVQGFEDYLKRELSIDFAAPQSWGPFFYAPLVSACSRAAGFAAFPEGPFWAQNVWLEPFRLEFDSINQAASCLRGIQRNWAPDLFTQYRRGTLITSKLPPLGFKPRSFPWVVPDSPMGAWTLLDAHTLIGSARCSSPFPGGLIHFVEDKQGPPSRAYLKLWETLVRIRFWPGPGDICLDAGASPGGWTGVLGRLGARVLAVDRSPPEQKVLDLSDPAGEPLIRYIRHDVFTLKPQDLGPLDWLFCDAACYPDRLYQWIEKWLDTGICGRFICTIKLQGDAGPGSLAYHTVRRFAAIPGSGVIHLGYNKHELTWIYLPGNNEQ